jgi:RimJ/RimL family protein N-acetyltransferase
MSNIWFETDRLVIRDFNQELATQIAEYRNDLEWMKYQGFKGFSVCEYVKAILSLVDIESGMQLAMTDKEGKLVGDLYVKANKDELRFGYTINKLYSRQGLTYEACKGLFKWAQSNGYRKLIAGVDPNNKASINLLLKLKMNKISSSADEDIYDYCF